MILEYCSKRIGYRNDAFISRHQLACMDYNTHVERVQLKRKDGTLVFGRRWGKRTKRWHAVPVPVPKTYSYIPGSYLTLTCTSFDVSKTISLKENKLLFAGSLSNKTYILLMLTLLPSPLDFIAKSLRRRHMDPNTVHESGIARSVTKLLPRDVAFIEAPSTADLVESHVIRMKMKQGQI